MSKRKGGAMTELHERMTPTTAREDDSLSDRVLVGTAITGAVCGAIAGVLITPWFGASLGPPEVFGALGTIAGSLLGTVLGHLVLRPVSAILHTLHPRPRPATTAATTGSGFALDA
jgi:uncharacterized membrane protein YoaK (UPF0700 family)